jgi:alkylation response protein AidB-like acyl-CoA dehydrogenase
MSAYSPPIDDMIFLLHDVLGFEHAELDKDTTEAILGEAGKLASEVLAPLNAAGDQNGAKLDGDEVTTAPGFKEAYEQYRDGGWNAVPFEEEFGGQGLPWAVAFPVQEMWQAANMSFGLCPLLNQGAVEAILSHGSDHLKQTYLPKLISGEWTGTMNLTEPQAGSDLGLLRAKAEPSEDVYKISGQKIFITYGEHDMAENIIHLVLARLPDAPDDVKGISLFIVPKFLESGERNAVKCIGLEHKLGIHASPTCTMEFDGAEGYLIGEPHQGLKYMFTMMNNARLSVGLQGVAIAEASYQKAHAFAQERVQGKSLDTGERVSIAAHADVKRMLLTMKSQVEAGRALTYEAAIALDAANAGDAEAQAKVDLLTPIVKSWCTDMACEVTSTGIQVHGGMGFIEETGAAQYYRDARILPIYEGTNGIQAADLAFRKTVRDGGAVALAYIEQMRAQGGEEFATYLDALKDVTQFLCEKAGAKELDIIAAAAAPYLRAFGTIAGGVLLSVFAEKAGDHSDSAFAQEKAKTAAFFKGNILPLASGYLKAAKDGAQSCL